MRPVGCSRSHISVCRRHGERQLSSAGVCDAVAAVAETTETDEPGAIAWAVSAEKELRKIPFFVRGKARRNTEHFAIENGLSVIDVETLYEAKAHYSR